jgi:tetratricopeptide (TPR) repeat protein
LTVLRLRANEQPEEAKRVLREAAKSSSARASTLVFAGLSQQALGDYQAAEDAFRRALQTAPGNAQALQGLGVVLTVSGRYEEAVPYLRQHLETNPADDITLTNLVTCLVNLGKGGDAEQLLRGAVARLPSVQRMLDLARILIKGEKWAEAVDILSQAAELEPWNVQIWRDLCRSFAEMEDWQAALGAIERALSVSDNDPNDWRQKALLLENLERYQEAAAVLSRAIDLASTTEAGRTQLAEWHIELAQLLFAATKADEAVAALRKAAGMAGRRPEIYVRASQLLRENALPEEALAILDQALDAGLRTDEDVTAERYTTFIELFRVNDAWEDVVGFWRESPPETGFDLFNPLFVLLAQGKWEAARPGLERAIQKFPDDIFGLLAAVGYMVAPVYANRVQLNFVLGVPAWESAAEELPELLNERRSIIIAQPKDSALSPKQLERKLSQTVRALRMVSQARKSAGGNKVKGPLTTTYVADLDARQAGDVLVLDSEDLSVDEWKHLLSQIRASEARFRIYSGRGLNSGAAVKLLEEAKIVDGQI